MEVRDMQTSIETTLDGSWVESVSITLSYSMAELTELLSRYDPAVPLLPVLSDCLPTVRAILDAELARREG